jgi:antitoxin (DNA-binding transcriptional repressor) of toxin-antitoxin stability system
MNTVTIEEAQAKLPEIIDKQAPGEELIITREDQPIAKLVGQQRPARKPRQPGSAKGKLTSLPKTTSTWKISRNTCREVVT